VFIKVNDPRLLIETRGAFNTDVNWNVTVESETLTDVNVGTDTICNSEFITDEAEILKNTLVMFVFLFWPFG
jgi:hypothetical protein